eukprot:CAMPEP_0115878806 /NCGR_PEP_ID=MMETSP0287-20121206/26976_1 /TAXON_ID=412157 /ORGANISM="Chrysochromulina rotalis, Strain UIO044" /LENGTH=45 /DNA_ID= /DNA_START= /DNA_END= /DNA_ORIENTATION=
MRALLAEALRCIVRPRLCRKDDALRTRDEAWPHSARRRHADCDLH